MASTYLQRTESAGNRRTFTWSAWIKRSKLGASQFLAACSHSSSDEAYFFFNGSDKLIWQSSSASYGDVQTNRVFRDTNSWYHIVLAVDTTQATASNRIRFYVNGVEETSFSTATYPAQDTQVYWNVGGSYYPRIGRRHAASDYFDGVMSHIAHIDGTQELPTIFGETDSTTGEWKIKTSITPSSGWGTNGYHILKDGNSVTDQSGQSNNWTVQGGTLTKTEDSPSNVFATWNPLAAHPSNTPTFSNGNNTVVGVDTSSQTVSSTLAMPSKGKWYCEMKLTQEANATSSIPNFGIIDAASLYKFRNQELISYNGGVNSYGGRVNSTNLYVDGSSSGTISSAPDVGNIMGLAVDLDSSPNTLKYYLNGSLVGTQNINNDEYVFACSIKNDNNAGQVDVNFGNGYFGTTAVSSAGTNASGNGIFEYDVPNGYTALSTKGLNL
ncbi:MAG: hypothetical protein CM15mL7_150 [uncultured marine virus]|nr:MAG: hypothetical protein CM15mL7_150 [uncultured marine virus]